MSPEIFQEAQTKRILSHILQFYGDEPEFLWERSPKTCIVRNAHSGKWYGIFFRLNGDKIGLDNSDEVEILNLRFEKGLAREFARSQMGVFPGYHMNKANWISILLNDGLSDELIFELLERSYLTASQGKVT